ncbi:MAG TPA: thiamine pyrophosphate-binding protein [Bacteroidales bacterium]|nr:thiamine pyrophosphate-binding protein [Bacteroidales bacterium]
MIKLSDYVIQKLLSMGVDTYFMVTGGGAMHLNDSIGRTPGVKYFCNHHEQASAIAAEGYFRTCGKMAAVSVTSGPGGLNTLTGLMGQWTDSVPAVYISGQVKYETTIHAYPHLHLRQLGDQEINVTDVVRPITKMSEIISDPLKIRYYLEKAVFTALDGRPGPVWLDIPLDIQASVIDENQLTGFCPSKTTVLNESETNDLCNEIIERLDSAKSPVIYLGNGVRLAKANELFYKLLDKLRIPVVTAINAHDLMWESHPMFFGRPGICGDRLGNIMLQNADLLIILGTRMGIRQISYNYSQLAPKAFRIMVDVDKSELEKPTLSIDLKIKDDLNHFLGALWEKTAQRNVTDHEDWIKWGRQIETLLPSIMDDNPVKENCVSSYLFADVLFKNASENEVIVTGNGTAYTSTFQIMKIKKGMRVIANHGCAAMGYDLPAALGACIANGQNRVVLITGDGSIMMNLQELQTIHHHNLPVKIFILNNNGYLAIRTTQNSFFKGSFVGESPNSGVSFPDFVKVAESFHIPAFSIENNNEIQNVIEEVLKFPGPAICEINMDPEQTLFPKTSSYVDSDGKIRSKPLEDMFPFLPQEKMNKCYYNQ